MRHEAPIAGFCAAALASVAAFAAGHGWIAVFTLPVWVVFGLKALQALRWELDGVRLREAQMWSHRLWHLAKRPQEDGGAYVCQYCECKWDSGEDERHDNCWYEAWQHAQRRYENEWSRWCER